MGECVDRLDNLNDPLAEWLRDGGESSTLTAGAELRHVVQHSLCQLTDGWLQRARPISGGRSATLAVYLPGDLVMLDVWSGAADRDHVTAITECELLCRPLGEFESVVDTNHKIARDVIRRLAQDTEFLREGLTAVSRMDARQRLLTFLHQTRARLIAAGQVEPGAECFALPMSQQQLGDAIGVTSIHVNRVLAALRRAGTLTFRDGDVAISDQAEFKRLGGAFAP